MPIPAMDPAKARQFNINSTLNLSERSPLIQDEQPNMYARMPTIFAKNKNQLPAEDTQNIITKLEFDQSMQGGQS